MIKIYIIDDKHSQRTENVDALVSFFQCVGKTEVISHQPAINKFIEEITLQYRGKLLKRLLSINNSDADIVDRMKLFYRVFFILNRRRHAINHIVTQKHLSALRKFLATESENALILENDAVLNTDTPDAIIHSLSCGDYVDLAGGYVFDNAKELLTQSDHNGLIRYPQLKTNTACAYAVNKKFASTILAAYEKDPFSASLPVDWLYLFLAQNSYLTSGRPLKYPFLHGSFSADSKMQSWQLDF